MPIRPIVQVDQGAEANVLSRPASEVLVVDSTVSEIIRDLTDTLHAHQIAVGLAAPQIGVPLRIAVINLKTANFEDLIIINPVVVRATGKRDTKKESCMSLRDFRGAVDRRVNLTVEYRDQAFVQQTIEAKGFLARVLAHEIDHLEGIMYTKRVRPGATLESVDFAAWERDPSGGEPGRG